MQTAHMLFVLVLLSCTASLISAQFQSNDDQESLQADPHFDSRISSLISNRVLQFSQEIGKQVLKDSTEKTQILSPLSIWGALSLVFLGAGGQTHRELMDILKFNDG